MLKNKKIFIKLIFVSALLAASYQTSCYAGTKPLNVGLLPYLSTRMLIHKWSPLIRYLEHELKRDVIVSTAPDFNTFLARANKQEYDIYFTAPHFAALAEQEQIYQRLVKFDAPLHGDVIVHKDSPYHSIADLKNKFIVTPDKLAIVTLLGEDFLLSHGLIPGKTVQVKHIKSHNSALYAVEIQQADAAIVVGGLIKTPHKGLKQMLRIISSTKNIPHSMLMVKNSLSKIEKNKIKQAIFKFIDHPEYSNPFYENIGFGKFTVITNEDMLHFKPILPMLIKRLKP